MNLDRTERFSKIRTLLGGAYEQAPSPHQILTQMLIEEQTLNLELTNTGKPWNLVSTDLVTQDGVSEYIIDQPVMDNVNSGRVHFVTRTTDNLDHPTLPVPFDDFSEADYGRMPGPGVVNTLLAVPEKISFFRYGMGNATVQAVIQPAPREELTYTIWFFAGAADRSVAELDQTGSIAELVDWLDLKAALHLLPYAEWSDDQQKNEAERKAKGAGLLDQISRLEPHVQRYIKRLEGPKTFDMDVWNA